MRLVVVESPYKARTPFGRWRNRRYARAAMADCLRRGEAPYASALLYTQPGVLRDWIEAERIQGIAAGLAWGGWADATVVYVDRGISLGMRLGIEAARRAYMNGLPPRPVEYRSLYGLSQPQIREMLAALGPVAWIDTGVA